jgi:hypothetical protein
VRTAKLVLGVSVGMLVAFGAGWLIGSAGRVASERAVQTAELRSDLLQARGWVLAARVDLYNVNFGDASGHLEDAKGSLRRVAARFKTAARTADATRTDAALAQLEEAQQMAGRLDQGANARAAAAAQAIDDLLSNIEHPISH